MYRLWLIIIVLSLGYVSQLSGQEFVDKPYDQRPSYGVYGHFNYNMHMGDFREIPDFPNCLPENFTIGSGFGPSFGIFYTLPLFDEWDLQIRAGYNDFSAEFSYIEKKYLSGTGYLGVDGEIEHTLTATLNTFSIEPMMTYLLTDQMQLHLGFRVGTLLTKTFDQYEDLKYPDYGGYVIDNDPNNVSDRWISYEGEEITDASSVEAALLFGAGYQLPLNKNNTLMLVPEVFYSFGITSIIDDPWTMTALKGGIALRYWPREEAVIIPPADPPLRAPMPALPEPPIVPELDAVIAAFSVDENGNESDVSRITVEEFSSVRIHPLLNYIFYEEGSADLPDKIIRLSDEEKEKFSDKYLANLKTLEVYYRVLNIVGNRMQKFPGANLTLVGCNSNQGAEAGNTALSRQRAENIKKFIVDEWDISPDRIVVNAQNLPDNPSNQTRQQGLEENRRVEMTSNFPQIFEPVKVMDTRRKTNPPLIRFKPKVNSQIGIASWKLITSQGGEVLKVFEGTGNIPSVIELDLTKEQKYVPQLNQPYEYKLQVVDNDNKLWDMDKPQKLEVEANTIQSRTMAMMDGDMVDEKEFFKLSLISFPFNRATLTEEHKPIIEDAKRILEDDSKVTIEGHTDNTGDANRNKKLSLERAQTVADALDVSRSRAFGMGMLDPLYQNGTPEGRLYNRTVYIEIENTISFE